MRGTVLAVVMAMSLAASCRLEPLTGEEAREAVEESSVASQAAALLGASVEISTDFTIGGAVEQAAAEIRSFVETQLPCAEVTLKDATLTIVYGARAGNCTYRGHRFEGEHSIHVARNEDNDVVVEHTWKELGNGRVAVSGDAEVTWKLDDPSRHVSYELTWTRLSDGRMGIGSGDVVQRPLDGGLVEGIQIDGMREWEGDRGHWTLDIDGVQMRWIDPVPQAGGWTLETPFDKTLSLDFERIDEDSIAVTVSGNKRSIALQVNSIGAVSRR